MTLEMRKQVGGFAYSLGSYPVGDYQQDEGYTVSMSRESGTFDQRFEFEIAVSIEKLIGLLVRLCDLLPEEVYLIFESYPRNASLRRVCLTDSVVKRDVFADIVTGYPDLWKDEGFVAFGAFSYEPAVEIFLNEHKTVVVYTPHKELTEELLIDFGLKRTGLLEPYYLSVEHVHSSVAERTDEGDPLPLRDRIEAELFERFDFYDHTPSPGDLSEYECTCECDDDDDDEEGCPDEVDDDAGVMHWRCHVHARLVVARPGTTRDFDQIFHLAAPDELDAVDLVRDTLREANARMVRVKELVPIDLTAHDLLHCPQATSLEQGVWHESERSFPDEVS